MYHLWSFQLILYSVRQGGGNTVLLRWQDHISTLHLFAWLMLGAMCHNAIDVVAVEMRMEGSVSGRCQLFGSLSTHQDEVIKGIIRLLLGALENVTMDREVVSSLDDPFPTSIVSILLSLTLCLVSLTLPDCFWTAQFDDHVYIGMCTFIICMPVNTIIRWCVYLMIFRFGLCTWSCM